MVFLMIICFKAMPKFKYLHANDFFKKTFEYSKIIQNHFQIDFFPINPMNR